MTLLEGCSLIDCCVPVNPILDAIDNSIAAFERSVQIGDETLTGVIVSLENTRDILIEEGKSTLANDVDRLIGASIAKTGNELRCNVDFLGNRGIDILKSIKDAIVNDRNNIDQSTPVICLVEPQTVDLNLVSTERTAIRFWGYDLDHIDRDGKGFKLSLINQDNILDDQSDHISLTTHYAGVINISGNGVALNNRAKQLILSWGPGNELRTEIPVLQPDPPETRVETIKLANSFQYIPPRVSGDSDFDGKLDIVASSRLVIVPTNRRVLAIKIEMNAQEDGGSTGVSGTSDIDSSQYEVYKAPNGFTIDEILSSTFDRFEYTDKDHDRDCFSPQKLDDSYELLEQMGQSHYAYPRSKYTNNGLVNKWCFVGDTDGDEAGTETKVTIILNEIQVKLIEDR